jgi:hypothetical protein
MHFEMSDAILREKRLKKWNRQWKIRIIEEMNPDWRDLFDEFWGAILDGPADRARLGLDVVPNLNLHGLRLHGSDERCEVSKPVSSMNSSLPRRRESMQVEVEQRRQSRFSATLPPPPPSPK